MILIKKGEFGSNKKVYKSFKIFLDFAFFQEPGFVTGV